MPTDVIALAVPDEGYLRYRARREAEAEALRPPGRTEAEVAALRAAPEYAELRAAYGRAAGGELDEARLLDAVDRLLGMVCGWCGERTRNNTQGHYWARCRVTGTLREPHFCCPDDCALGDVTA